MANKNINQDRDNGIWGELLTQQDNQKALDELKKLTKPEVPADGGPAKSFWSTGRHCPKCKGLLKMKELNQDTGYLWVFCGSCKSEFCADDLENTSEIGDKLHRQIPDDVVLRWMAANDLRLKTQGK
jgi:hypothetical protein